MKFKVGQNVVHSKHGVGIIKGIEKREFKPGQVQQFYIMEIQDCGAPKKVFVPFESNALRNIMKEKDVQEIYNILNSNSTDPIDHQTWNRRYREYMDRIGSGDAKEIATVTRSLFQLRKDKDLSFGERKLLDHAKSQLVKELAIAENRTESEIEDQIESIFNETTNLKLVKG